MNRHGCHEEHFEQVKLLGRDLRNGKEFPRSPPETLTGFVLAAHTLDKCRAVLVGWQEEYHSNCPLDQTCLIFAEIDYEAYKLFVATGATDDEVATRIEKHANKRCRADIVEWNNREPDQQTTFYRNYKDPWRTTSFRRFRATPLSTVFSTSTTLVEQRL